MSTLSLMSFHILNVINDEKLFENIFCKNSYKVNIHHKSKVKTHSTSLWSTTYTWNKEMLQKSVQFTFTVDDWHQICQQKRCHSPLKCPQKPFLS